LPCSALEEGGVIEKLGHWGKRKWWSTFLRNCLCWAYEIGMRNTPRNPNHIFQENGVQSATLDLRYPPSLKNELAEKMAKVGISFAEEFSVMEDHLHSASTLYLPLNELNLVPIQALIIPGISFVVVAAAYLITKTVNLMNKVVVNEPSQHK
jgi:hypothetical protein